MPSRRLRPRLALLALAAAALLLVAVAARRASAGRSGAVVATFTPVAGHTIAGFAVDREDLALAEDPVGAGGCPLVLLVAGVDGRPQPLDHAGGATCRLGGRFWVRPGARAIGVAFVRAVWVVRNGDSALAAKASDHEPEQVLASVTGIDAHGPFLGPVAATNWLRLVAYYTVGRDGTLTGTVISGNRRLLWADSGPVLPLGLDDKEHAVSVGADGSIAMWHAHGARYGRVADAHARAAALELGRVYVLRDDAPRLDVRLLSGRRVASWPVARDAAPLLDVDGRTAVYLVGRRIHELDVVSGRDRVVATAPAHTTLLDAQIERRLLVYAYRGGPAGPGRVVVLRR
jgi:hypothetical protein